MVLNGQSYAVEIEHILWKVFNCERFGFGGMVDADYIRKYPFHTMMCGLSFLYAKADAVKQKAIEKFFEDYSFYADMSIDDLLSFDNSAKTVDNVTIEIGFKNGKQAIEHIISQFRQLCK